jgi:putative nucleotidyltransferase with HDIG domain
VWRRLKLRHLLFGLLLLYGLAPLGINNLLFLGRNRDLLETQEKTNLTRSAEALSREINEGLVGARLQLTQAAQAILAPPGPQRLADRLRERWLVDWLERFAAEHPHFVTFRFVTSQGEGIHLGAAGRPDAVAALDRVHALGTSPGYVFAVLAARNQPVAAMTVAVAPAGPSPAGGEALRAEAVVTLPALASLFEREAAGGVDAFLLGRDGEVLWSHQQDEAVRRAVRDSDVVRDFARYPLSLTAEYELAVEGGTERPARMLAMVSPVAETGWGVLVHRPAAAVFRSARDMVWSTLAASALLVIVSLAVAAFVARRVSKPIQRLAETTHEIAEGHFGRRVEAQAVGAELQDLAEDFNQMSGHLEDHVEKLRVAASSNQELFIGSIRAFAAAIDAKDPYTRGHSERVAEASRAIARHLGQTAEMQERCWIGALLHDIGKIGVDDRILEKGAGLSEDEFEEMRAHPIIGAEILSPVAQLKDMIPAVRWHHEAWNGRGYPDGLRGEGIPLIARVVAVADCFDAITTDRPYQQAFTPEFAVQRITELVGTRFDAKVVTAFLRAFEAGEVRSRAPLAPSRPTSVATSPRGERAAEPTAVIVGRR